MQRLHWILPALFLSWASFSLLLLAKFGSHLPVVITNILSLALVPFFLALPVLKTLGLSIGELWTLPNLVGFLLVGGVFCFVLYGLGRLIQICFHKSVT
jgi:hypothetical protein